MNVDTGIREARRSDIPAMSEMWRLCFGDPDDYIRFFYDRNFDRLTAFVYTVDDRPVSMVQTMDSCFVDGQKRYPAKYICAAGTHPGHRHKGYYGMLFAHMRKWADEGDHALFGKPASRGCVPMYESYMLRTDACMRLVTAEPEGKTDIAFYTPSAEEYNRLRNAAFSAHPHAEWPDGHTAFCMDENAWFGGKTLAFSLDGGVHFLMAAPEDGTLIITETDLTLPQLKRAAAAFNGVFGTERVRAYLPDFACGEGEEILSSMVYNSPFEDTYVNLILL